MKITLSPQRSNATLALSKTGDVLTINGEAFDFGPLPNGATLPSEAVGNPFIVGPVDRDENGELHITVLLPHGPDAPEAVRFPNPATGTITEDGPIALPGQETTQ